MIRMTLIAALLPFTLLGSSKLSYSAETILLSGTVLNESARPIDGANVRFKRNDVITHAARTDSTGRFRITDDQHSTMPEYLTTFSPMVSLNGSILAVTLAASCPVKIAVYGINGRKCFGLDAGVCNAGLKKIVLPTRGLGSGMHIITIDRGGHGSIVRWLVAGRQPTGDAGSMNDRRNGTAVLSARAGDTLVVTAVGFIQMCRPVFALVDSGIVITLNTIHYDNVTPSNPVVSANGGSGNVTTYGSVSNPGFSAGGACNYGSTKILYYAAINVHQVHGDNSGNWQGGRACGRCARVRVLTKDGWRGTVVRIVDKCADMYGGIDLGGAPARDCMGTQPGRYHGEWQWVNCEEGDSVSDGPPALYVKDGSNPGWSAIQARNGPGGVAAIRVRKAGTVNWESLTWAIQPENFFIVPVYILQDTGDWDIEVDWDTGSSSSARLPGSALAVAEKMYLLQF